jgi:hypothetical protein
VVLSKTTRELLWERLEAGELGWTDTASTVVNKMPLIPVWQNNDGHLMLHDNTISTHSIVQ